MVASCQEHLSLKQSIVNIIDSELNTRNQLILKTLYYLGLRASEICNLKWSDITLQPNGTGTLTVKNRGSKIRFLIIPKQLLNELLAFKKDGQTYVFTSRKFNGHLNRTQLWKIVKAAGERCGVENFNLHWCRHLHANQFLSNELDVHPLSSSLKHKKVTTTSHYLHRS